MALVRYRLFCTQPAVLLTVYQGSLSFSPSSWSPALQHKAGKCHQLQFPSCCLRQEQIFPSIIRGFGYSSASFAIVGDWTPTRLGVVHVLKELSMPLATHLFPTCMDNVARKQGEQEVAVSTNPPDNRGGGGQRCKGWPGFTGRMGCVEQRRIKLC